MKAVSFVLAASVLLSTSAHAGNKPLSVPADWRAKYFVVDKSWRGGERVIVMKRVARDGTRYSKHLYNCEKNTVRSLGEGGSLEEMEAVEPETKMGLITPDSISYFISIEACRYLKET